MPQASEEDLTHCTFCGSDQLRRESDVLDTWFSSGLWPLSTMGWPEETADLKTFYPTAVLVTGYDILFFWVARMAMFGLKFRDAFLAEKLPLAERVPFREVLLHGLLRDQHGEKMSKTKGNGIDPLEMIDKYGADALRFTLAAGTTLGQDMVLQEATIEGYGNFINKLWNATKFHLIHVDKLGPPLALEAVQPGKFERWILGRLDEVAGQVNRHLDARRFNEACQLLYHFAWHDLCDWYLEISKPMLNGDEGASAQAAAHAVFRHVLSAALRLLHPFMPFVTEELWLALGHEGFVMTQPYPAASAEAGGAPDAHDVAAVMALIETIRNVRGEHKVKPRQSVSVVVKAQPDLAQAIQGESVFRYVIRTLAGVEELGFDPAHQKRPDEAYGVGTGFEVFVNLAGLIDAGQERTRLQKELERLKPQVDRLQAKLANPGFLDKAPAAVVAKNRDELASMQAQLDKLSRSLTQLGA
jgi:valyl-tRNA synthetase